MLDEIASKSPRREQAVVLRRQLLDALSAPNEVAYHQQMRGSPVVVANIPGSTSGRTGVFRTYSVHGKERIRFFIPNDTHYGSREPGTRTESIGFAAADEGDGELAPDARSQSSTVPLQSENTFCELTVSGQYFSGDCATAEEIDEAGSAIAVMEAEISAQNAEVISAGGCNAYSGEEPCRSWETQNASENEDDALMAGAASFEGTWLYPEREDSSSWTEAFPGATVSSKSTCESASLARAGSDTLAPLYAPRDCLHEGIGAAISVAGWVGAKFAAYGVIMAAAPPAAAVAWTVFGVMTSGYAAAMSLNAYYQCKQ